ncbi:hypothetical protein DDB_G0293922 [Dictyostelium discoideum AX4]|uniref:TraB family protein n=1 Tax=Dictyostelium discoideum TaxID=44689 RepID=Q54B42_DICDI|nr:hypothetical protein DDB_G0293922 [Dictyostelium discoideum AX4]EAL60460.1 hypothetical protein DDB_G0293922 [Dictyostelium discoideum AX4]|eukprot:XP_628874.1 hypothetical protein DDB_G0293922 [Dictyostelium discoideum AX4]
MNDEYYDSLNNKIQKKNEINFKENIEILKRIKENIKDSEKIINVVINEKTNTVVYLIGTIHVSQQSCEDIKTLLSIVEPDTIFIELSNERAPLLTSTEDQIISQLLKKPNINWFTTKLSDFYLSIHQNFYYYTTKISMNNKFLKNQIGNNVNNENNKPYIYGNEFRIGYQYSKLNKCSVLLGDRNFKSSWNRIFNYLDLKTILELGGYGVKTFFKIYNQPIDEIREEYYKSVNELIDASWKSDIWRRDLPMAVQRGLIDERDQFMASCIRDAPHSKRMVAIVGKGHIKGISNHINDKEEGFYIRSDLEGFQEPTLLSKYSYPILMPSLLLLPPTLSIYSFHRFIKPLSKPKFTLALLSTLSIELFSIKYLISNFENKLEKL